MRHYEDVVIHSRALEQERHRTGLTSAKYSVVVGLGSRTKNKVLYLYDDDLAFVGWYYMNDHIQFTSTHIVADDSVLSPDCKEIVEVKPNFPAQPNTALVG